MAELDAEQFAKAVKQSANRKSFVREAICRVRNSGSFRGAEANLRVVELCSGELDHEDIECLHEAIKANGEENVYNQVRLAGDTEDILKNVFSASSSTQEARRAWRALAEWLNAEGTKKDDGFLYCDLLEACQ